MLEQLGKYVGIYPNSRKIRTYNLDRYKAGWDLGFSLELSRYIRIIFFTIKQWEIIVSICGTIKNIVHKNK